MAGEDAEEGQVVRAARGARLPLLPTRPKMVNRNYQQQRHPRHSLPHRPELLRPPRAEPVRRADPAEVVDAVAQYPLPRGLVEHLRVGASRTGPVTEPLRRAS